MAELADVDMMAGADALGIVDDARHPHAHGCACRAETLDQ
jgi:hypothetical protein